MKKIVTLTLVASVFMMSCQKTVQKPADAVTASASDQVVGLQSNMDLLCAHTWKYMRYYNNYINPKNLGTLVYQRGSTSNTINLDLNRVTFSKDGTVDEIDQNGYHVPGTWYFTDAAQTTYIVNNSYGSFATNILSLTDKRYYWTNGAGIAAAMIPTKK